MKFDLQRFIAKPFFISLGVVTTVYFAAIRFFQDWLYHAMEIDVRPADMFASFGPLFSQAEPFEIVLYLMGYVVVPAVAYFITPLKSSGQALHGMTRKVAGVLAAILVLVFVFLFLKVFPFMRLIEYMQTHSLGHVFWFITTKRIVVTYLMLALGAVFFVICYLFEMTRSKRVNSVEALHATPLRNGMNPISPWEARIKRFWPALCILLAFLIFNPSFPIDPHHYNYFLGSVHEVYQGKALLYESSNLYGLFNIYFLLALFKLIPLSFTVFAGVIMAVYVLYFSALWIFIRKWLHSYALATLATGVIVAITYFFQTGPSRSVLFLPAMGPFRWGLYVIVLFLMLGFERSGKSKYLHGSLFVAAFSLFWNFDSGLFLSAATLGTVGYVKLIETLTLDSPSSQTLIWDLERKRNKNRFQSFLFDFLFSGFRVEHGMTIIIRRAVEIAGEFFGYVLSLFAVTSVVNKVIYGSWPHWALFFRENKYFSTGIAMYPLPKIGVFEILFVVYAIVFVFMLYSFLSSRPKAESLSGEIPQPLEYDEISPRARSSLGRNDGMMNIPLVFLTFYGIFSFIYYIGESSWQILYVVVAPGVLISAYAYHQCMNRHPKLACPVVPPKADTTGDLESRNQQQKENDLSFRPSVASGEISPDAVREYDEIPRQAPLIRSFFITLVFFGIVLLAFKLPLEFSQRDYRDIKTRFLSMDPRDRETASDAEYLKTNYPDHRMPVVSLNDTKLMMYSGKVNAFDFYYIFTIYFRSEMQNYVDQVIREKPEYVIVGKDQYRNDQVEYFLNGIRDYYSLKEPLQTIEIHQSKTEK